MDTFLNDLLGLLDWEGETSGDSELDIPPMPRAAMELVATSDGMVLHADGAPPWDDEACRASIARELAARLADQTACCWKWSHEDREGVVLGCRLLEDWAGRIAGCVTDRLYEPMPSDASTIARAVCGLLAADTVVRCQTIGRLQTRIDHLHAERDTLKASHTEALAAALAERERRLSEQESHLRQQQILHLQNQMILNSAGEGIMGLDTAGTIIFVNPTGAAMLGHRVDELIGKPCHEMIQRLKPEHPSGEPFCCSALGKASCSGNEMLRRKDGGRLPIDYTRTSIRDGGQCIGAVITYRDMTEQRKLEASLRQAQKMESIGQLAAGIAHEINTPTQYIGDNSRFLSEAFGDLRNLLSACEDLQRSGEDSGPPDPRMSRILAALEGVDLAYLLEEIPNAINQSLDGVQRVAKIVRSMKEFSHPSEDEKQAVDLKRAIENTLTVSRNEWKYVAEVVTDFDPQLPPVACYPGDLNQVMLNLIINAAHAIGDKTPGGSGPQGTIRVSTRQDGFMVEIRVSDTGMGIPESIGSRVYDPFFTTKPVGRGTGQGLAIAHAIITEKHGGTIDFESEVGQGTTFILRIPLGNAVRPGERT